MSTTLGCAFELLLTALLLIWMKRGTDIVFGYNGKRLGKTLLFLLPFCLIFCFLGFTSTPGLMAQSTLPPVGVILLGLFQGAAPGFFEELAIRGLGVTSMMDVWRDRGKVVVMSACVSAVIFGLLHASNFLQGDFWGTLGQIFNATGMGVMFAGAYLRTRNLLGCSILHSLVDATINNNTILENDLGIVSDPTDPMMCLVLLAFGLAMAALGLFLIRRKKQDEMRTLWYPA